MIEEQKARGQEGKRETSLNTLAPCGRAKLRTDGAKRVRIAEQRGRISPQGLKARVCGAWSNFKTGQGEGSMSLNKTLSRICKFAYCSLTNSTLSQRERVKHAFTLAEVFSSHFAGRRKTAFTLAEVLITLGIIGIVAALTLPAVIANHQSSVLQQRFKKAYSSMSQVLQSVAFEDGISSVSNLIKACNDRIIKSSVCLYGQSNCDTTIFPFINYESATNLSSLFNNHYGITWHVSNLMNDGILALNDGTFIYFDYGDGSGKTLITIDINGWQKKPNKGGVDLFMFELKSNGALVPVENITPTNETSPLSRNTNCLTNPDITCTYEALSNPDYFKKVKK